MASAGVAALLCLSVATGCTTVAADTTRRDVVVAVERVTALPSRWSAGPAGRVRVITAGAEIACDDASVGRDGDTLVLTRDGAELWRGVIGDVQAVELLRTYTSQTRLRAETDDAGSTALSIAAIIIVGLVTVAAIFSGSSE